MKKETRLCPYKKGVKRNGMEVYDIFRKCEGENCMAYKDGNCLRLQSEDRHPYQRSIPEN